MPLQILLVDDHTMVRKGLRAFLETQPDLAICGEVDNGEDALTFVQTTAPDIILLDIILPGISGSEAARSLKTLCPQTTLLALTSSQEPAHVLEMMTAGASAYVLKDIGPAELSETIRRVARGEIIIDSRLATRLFQNVNPRPPVDPLRDLTPREREVLRLIADGLSNATIAQTLFLSEKTVKTHVSNLLGKLQLEDRTQAAVFAWKQGLKSSDPSSPSK